MTNIIKVEITLPLRVFKRKLLICEINEYNFEGYKSLLGLIDPRISKSITWKWKDILGKSIDSPEYTEFKYQRSSSHRQRSSASSVVSAENYNTVCLGHLSQFNSAMSRDCLSLENSIVELFNKSGEVLLTDCTLASLHENVRNLLDSNIGSFVYDRYKSLMLKRGMLILKNRITNNQHFIEGLSQIWSYFFSTILPALDCILFRVKAKCGLTIRQTTLIEFRDEVIFKTNFEEKLNDLIIEKKPIPANIKHMLLILQSIYECYPPTKNKIRIETLTALVVNPYMGYKGLYLEPNNSEPTIPSREPLLNAKRKSIDLLTRSVSRPLTMQPKQLETLNELFATALRKIS